MINMSNDKSKSRGLSGLDNLGNTCYMNSAIQSISATNLLNFYLRKTMFRPFLKDGIHRILVDKLRNNTNLDKDSAVNISAKKLKHKFKSSITYRTYQVLKIMWNINCELKPLKFKVSIDKNIPQFSGYSQHDAQEFLMFFLDKMHEEIKCDVKFKGLKLNKEILDYVEKKNKYLQKIKDSIDENAEKYKLKVKEHREQNYLIDIQYEGMIFYKNFLKNNHSIITDLFYGIFINEICCENCNNKTVSFEAFNFLQLDVGLIETNLETLIKNYFKTEYVEYTCDECKQKRESPKTFRIFMLPEKLIIHCKRFITKGRHSRKNNVIVSFPIDTLEMEEVSKVNKSFYELYSVINHMGDVGGGHYTNYSKNSILNEWYEFNDSSVNYLKNPEKEITSSSAYILFYQKKR